MTSNTLDEAASSSIGSVVVAVAAAAVVGGVVKAEDAWTALNLCHDFWRRN